MVSTRSDRLFGLLMVILAITYGWLSFNFESSFAQGETLGPQTFPQIIAVILGISGLWLSIKPDPDTTWGSKKTWLELLLTIITLLIYAVLLEPIGFIPTSILCCGFLSYRMGATLNRAFTIACIYSICLFFLFNFILKLSLPLGILEDLI